jgi:DNA-binding NarL/FixJ family response regulator
MNKPRILVADDHELVRAGLVAILARHRPQWPVIGQASNGMEALELATKLRPDVTVLDLLMPRFGGLQFIKKLRNEARTRVLVVSGYAAESAVQQVEDAGANGLLSKRQALQQLVPAIEQVLQNAPFFSSTGTGSEAVSRDFTHVKLVLSSGELDVFRVAAEGKCAKDIARLLGMSIREARIQRSKIQTKLRAPSVAELTRLAIRDNVI